MDHLNRFKDAILKHRFALLVLLVGVVLMLIPGQKQTPSTQETALATSAQERDMEGELAEILSMVHGVGKVRVMLTPEEGELTVYQTDEGSSGSNTVIITDQNRMEEGLVKQILCPKYRGAVVVCQGADSPAVRLAVVEAVARVTGLGTDQISVLKMK